MMYANKDKYKKDNDRGVYRQLDLYIWGSAIAVVLYTVFIEGIHIAMNVWVLLVVPYRAFRGPLSKNTSIRDVDEFV